VNTYKEVHTLADGTELRHTLMNSAIPADRDTNLKLLHPRRKVFF
jgi:hypothetical protein